MARLVVLLYLAVTVWSSFQDYRRTPYGWMHPDCVHVVPSGSHLEELSTGRLEVHYPNGMRTELPTCKFPYVIGDKGERPSPLPATAPAPNVGHGWQAYTTFQYPKGMNTFLGTFSIPNKPAQEPDILYIFTGLQNINWIPEPSNPPPSQPFDIIQPVLEYTEGSWSVASWYVTLEQGVVESTPMPVSPGQSIFGNMTKLSSDGTWYIGSTIAGTTKTTQVTIKKHILISQPWAYTALEVYGVSSCKQYPTNSINFTAMAITDNTNKPLSPQWVAHVGQEPACKEQAVINSPSSVTILFGNE